MTRSSSYLPILLALSLLFVLLCSVPVADCKKGHPKERHHGSDRIGRNQSLAIAISKRHAQPLRQTPTRVDQGVQLSSLSSSHDYLSSLLPPQAKSIRHSSPPSHSPSRSLSIDPSHFHTVYNNASLHSNNKSTSTQPVDNETEVTLTDSYHVMYTAEVSIGSPAQSFNMILDTGSSCLWAISAAPASAEYPTPHPRYLHYYDHSQSSTYQPDGRPWEIQYGVGACTGFLSRDAVTLATLTASNQTFAEATRLSANFLNPQQPLDGIVGMSFAGGACKEHRTFIESLWDERAIGRRVFSFHLDTREGEDEENVLVIGDEEGDASGADERVVYTEVLHAPKREPAMWFELFTHISTQTQCDTCPAALRLVCIQLNPDCFPCSLLCCAVFPLLRFVHLEEMSIIYAEGTIPPRMHNDSLQTEGEEEGEGKDERDDEDDSDDRRTHRRRYQRDNSDDSGDDVFRLRERREASRRLRSFLAQHRVDDQLSSLVSNTLSFCGPSTGPCIALPDTGTSFLTLPTRLFILLVSLITHGRDDCVIDSLSNLFCLGDINTLPSLAFTFSGERFILTPRDYVLPNRQLAVQVLDFGVESLNIVILGDVFLRRVRVVFDEEQWRVGFVKRLGEGSGEEEQWRGGGLGGGVDAVDVSLMALLLVMLLTCCVCLLCCCVLVDWCWRHRRSSEYQPIPQ